MISGMEGEQLNLISCREKMMEAPVVLTSAPTILLCGNIFLMLFPLLYKYRSPPELHINDPNPGPRKPKLLPVPVLEYIVRHLHRKVVCRRHQWLTGRDHERTQPDLIG